MCVRERKSLMTWPYKPARCIVSREQQLPHHTVRGESHYHITESGDRSRTCPVPSFYEKGRNYTLSSKTNHDLKAMNYLIAMEVKLFGTSRANVKRYKFRIPTFVKSAHHLDRASEALPHTSE